jgi:site-specific DNA recombinase
MTSPGRKRIRCAIYTRVSTDHGLDQDFNSLDAQRDAAQAYIRSQAHAGWTLMRGHYDDGGYSGGSTDRPGLQQLLTDVKAGRIDVIVVYKVDRLTRSLADFAKLVELFDAHGVSFVSVTQQFNTTSSMGRLTLNVLLSFAQFEREVTSERIRDKIAASKRKGLWVGGIVPLGYESRDRKLIVVEAEAERVRLIFRRYLELGSLNLLLADLRQTDVVTKIRPLSTRRSIGGIPFTRGPLAYLLRNRFYVGEVVYKGQVCPGEQPAILDRELFEAVQERLEAQRSHHVTTRLRSGALLQGRIFDDRGRRMTPTHATKQGVRYRYYISAALVQGQSELAGSTNRVPATEIEPAVLQAVRDHIGAASELDDRSLIAAHVDQVQIRAGEIEIILRSSPIDHEPGPSPAGSHAEADIGEEAEIPPTALKITIPWRKTPNRRRREIIIADTPADLRPARAETSNKLIVSIGTGRRWLAEIMSGSSVEHIASREGCSVRRVTMMLSLSFVAPALVKAAADGRLPRGIGVSRLFDPPAEWSRQHQMLGLPTYWRLNRLFVLRGWGLC